jgi:hypothetical protein
MNTSKANYEHRTMFKLKENAFTSDEDIPMIENSYCYGEINHVNYAG